MKKNKKTITIALIAGATISAQAAVLDFSTLLDQNGATLGANGTTTGQVFVVTGGTITVDYSGDFNNGISTMANNGLSGAIDNQVSADGSRANSISLTYTASAGYQSAGIFAITSQVGVTGATSGGNLDTGVLTADGIFSITSQSAVGSLSGDGTTSLSYGASPDERGDFVAGFTGSTFTYDYAVIGGNNTFRDPFNVDFTAVPEPSSTALLGLGGLALLMRRKRA